jgi:RNA polymerase sigma-70 factor (ECF subfamily)
VAGAAAGGDLHSAEDAVQVTYMRMFTSWEEIVAQPGNRAAYGRTAVKNAVVAQFRRNQRMVLASLREMPEQESQIGIPDAAYGRCLVLSRRTQDPAWPVSRCDRYLN